jgi:hypothetical protein
MHPSYFVQVYSIKAHGAEISLSGEFSEWLFQTGYWHELSASNLLSFEQYEEEIMPCSKIPHAILNLREILKKISGSNEDAVEFTYGWDAARRPLKCSISVALLFSNVEKLLEFFEHSAKVGVDIYCQL